MGKKIKVLIFIIGSLLAAILINLTLSAQYLLITYITTFLIYLFFGFLIQKVSIFISLLFLSPLLILNILAIILNPMSFPLYSPITIIIAFFSVLSGYFFRNNSKKQGNRKFYFFAISGLSLVILFSFYIAPYILFNKSRIKISPNSEILNKLHLIDLENNHISNVQFKNKTILVDYWFLDCYQCNLKLPSLQELISKVKNDTTIKVISVINGKIDSLDEVKKFIIKHPEIKFPIYLDKFNSIGGFIKITGYPIEFIIDKGGKLKETHEGFSKDERMIYVKETYRKLKRYDKN